MEVYTDSGTVCAPDQQEAASMALKVAMVLYREGFRALAYDRSIPIGVGLSQSWIELPRKRESPFSDILVPLTNDEINDAAMVFAQSLRGKVLRAIDLEIPAVGVIEAAIGRFTGISVRCVSLIDLRGDEEPVTRFDVLHSKESQH